MRSNCVALNESDFRMWTDPIVDGVRSEAKRWADQFAGDVEAMFAELKRLEQESGREYLELPPRPPALDSVIAPLASSAVPEQSHSQR